MSWTPETLYAHFTELRVADKEAVKIAQEAAQRATDKAEEAQTRVNSTQNEFRGSLKDQAATLMPRTEVEQSTRALQKQLDDLKRLVYIGLGIVLALQFLIPILLKR